MARRKAKTRTVYKTVKKSKVRRKSSSKVNPIQIDAITYGAVRGFISQKIAQFTKNIPILNISDEVGMGAVDYLVAKNSSGMIKKVALTGLTVENARFGETGLSLVTGGLGKNTTQSAYLYG